MTPSDPPAAPQSARRPWQRAVLRLALFVLIPYLLVCCLVWAVQERLVFPRGGSVDLLPSQVGLVSTDLEIPTPDGEMLRGWWLPHPQARRTVLHLHGNAGTISDRLDLARELHALKLSVLLVDWRGYGRSTGTPTADGLRADAQAMWSHLTGPLGIDPGMVILHGQSLGGGLATFLAAAHPEAAGVVLESTFTSLADVAGDNLPWLPVRLLLGHDFPSAANLARTIRPVLILHARDDGTIPFAHGERLAAVAGARATFVPLPDGGHNGILDLQGAAWRAAWSSFLDRLDAPR